jgi:transcriptional regulator with XRE-family HTH domain
MSWMRNLAISNAFALVLKKHRKAKGMSQELLAEKADIHPIYVGMIERSLRNPSLNVAQGVADALGCRGGNKRRQARVQKETRAYLWELSLGRGAEEAGA